MSSHHPADVFTMMFLLIVFLTALSLGQCTSCTAYSFDTANVAHLYVQDNSTVKFTFSVRYDTACGANANSLKSVEISEQKQSSRIEALCIFEHENGNCIPPLGQTGSVCSCNPEAGWYSITSRLFRDSGDRNLTVYGELFNGTVFDTTVMVHIVEPAVISSLIVQSNNKEISEDSPAIPNCTVSITCLWDKGEPGQSAVLKRDKVVLDAVMSTGSNDLNRVEHIIHNVQCQDTGMVSCEAAGARENKTQMIIVKCDPKFGAGNISILATSELHTVHFPVTAYDRNIRTCELLQYDLSSGTYGPGNVDCVRIASLKGSVPNLNLTIQLPPLVKNVGGRWRLDLTNNGGKGSVYFTIQVEEETPEGLTVPVLSAVITGPVVVAVNVIALFVICFKRRKKRGKISRLPSPPAPHTFRRRAPDAVMFHVHPAGQGHRDSFISVHDHIYSEIPDDSETSDENVQSHVSSPLSEGSLSEDFLRNIACPSSNSSLSDDDPARPNTPASSLITTTATVHPTPKTVGAAAMTIADSWGEPPHDRNARMLSSSGSIFGEDASHPRVSCVDELKTATTVHTAGSGEEKAAVTPAVAWAEPFYENNISIPPCHTLNDDYLQPSVSTLATERPAANMSAGTMSTVSDGASQRESTTQVSAPLSNNSLPDDYLHPIASVLEGATPATPARSDRQAQGRTASVRTASDVQPQKGTSVTKPQPHNNLPDENLHPVSAALDKKTTAGTVQPNSPGDGEAVYEPPYENTMEKSPRLSHHTLPDDYLHPVTSTQDFATSSIELSSSYLTSRAGTRSRSDPPYENTREMLPSLSDNTLTDDHLHPVSSTTAAATRTTVTNSPCLVTPTSPDSTHEPPYENIGI